MNQASWDHWLVGALRRELPDHARLDHISSFTPLDEAWRELATALDRSQESLADALAARFRMPRADLSAADPAAAQLLTDAHAARLNVVALAHSDRTFTVATAHPLDAEMEQELAFLTGRQVRFHVATPAEIADHQRGKMPSEGIIDDVMSHLAGTEGIDDLRVLEDNDAGEISERELEKTPVVRLTNMIVQKAVEANATDIHIEPERDGGRVRFRVDGVLQPFMHLPLPALVRVVSRIKILAQLDIADRMRPQDGRMRIEVLGRTLDLRISTVPLTGAEKVVIRVLDPAATFSLDRLGIPERERARLEELMGHRHGIVLVTGPTGSGKTTTLYGALGELSSAELNISTVEHPVEYELRGISQIQVDPRKGVTFSSALRALLRQDPDVILLGEIRDEETAEIAAQASMTGHMVLSTLHTNDAIGAVARLHELGLDPSVVGSSLRGVVAQRLVRTLCPSCVRPVKSRWELGPAEQALAERTGELPTRWAPGCDACRHTGFRGRIPILEVLQISRPLAKAIARGSDEVELRDMLIEAGHRVLLEAALDRVRAGDTSLLEIDRVVGIPEPSEEEDRRTDDPTGTTLEAPAPAAVVSAPGGTPAPAPAPPASVPPVAPQRAPAVIGASEPTPFCRENEQIISFDDARRRRDEWPAILVVDDDTGTRRLIRASLERVGYEVVEAEDGQEALELLERGRAISLVTLDLNMPRVGGMEVLARMRSTPEWAGIPVIVATHSDDEASELRLLQAGADDYVVKPISPTRLMTRVEAVIRRHQVLRAPARSTSRMAVG